MMHTERDIDLFVDGLLDGEAAERVRAQIASDPALRAEVEQLRAVDDRLRRFMVSASPEGGASPRPLRLTDAPAPAPAGRSRRLWAAVLAVAAILLIAGGVAVWKLFPLPDRAWTEKLIKLTQRQIADGFVPQVVCSSREQFEEWTTEQMAQPLIPALPATGVEIVGWSYDNSFSGYAPLLLAKVDSHPVLVVMDLRDQPRVSESVLADAHLHGFANQVGKVHMIEITPLDRPRVVSAIQVGTGRGCGR